MLTKEDCRQRAPCDGDVIFNTLDVLMNNTARVDDGLLTYLLIYLFNNSSHTMSTTNRSCSILMSSLYY